MWEEGDRENYNKHVNERLGQICNDDFSDDIRQYASDPKNKTFLEIGTWNGLGSTKAFVEGFAQRARPDSEGFAQRARPTQEEKEKEDVSDYIFYSLECNADKCADAAKLYADNTRVHILNEVIWNQEPADFYEVFPQCRTNPTLQRWHEIDMLNMQKCQVFLDRPEIPPMFDVILLDGGEFTTYYEYQLLKKRCKILMLDDVNADKCKKIVQEIEADPSWCILKRGDVRGGYLIAERMQ